MGWAIGWTDAEASIEKERVNAYREALNQALCTLLQANGPQEVQRQTGRFPSVPEAQVLWTGVHGAGNAEGAPEAQGIRSTGKEIGASGSLRSMPNDTLLGDSSQGSRLEQQRPKEFADTLQFVSYVATSCTGGHKSRATEAALHALRKTELSERFVQHLPDTDQAIWRSKSEHDKAEMIVQACWTIYANRNRASRLRACGNGVVALQASLSLVLLVGRASE